MVFLAVALVASRANCATLVQTSPAQAQYHLTRRLVDQESQPMTIYTHTNLFPVTREPVIQYQKPENAPPRKAQATQVMVAHSILAPKNPREGLRVQRAVNRNPGAKLIILNAPYRARRSSLRTRNNDINEAVREIHVRNKISRLNQGFTPSADPFKPSYSPSMEAYGSQYNNYHQMMNGGQTNWGQPNSGAPPPIAYGADYIYGELAYPTDTGIKFEELDKLVAILNSVGGIYNYYYEILPKQEVSQTKKTMWDKAYDAGQFYMKVRTFVSTIINDRPKLMEQLNFLNGRAHMLRTTEDDMIRFFGVEKRYYRAKIDGSKYFDKDPKFAIYFNEVRQAAVEFDTDVKLIVSGCSDLFTLNSFFQQQIDSLRQTSYNSTLLNVLDKLDKVIMLFVKLLEIKEDFAKSIDGIKKGLVDLGKHRSLLAEKISSVETLAEFYRAKELAAAQSLLAGVGVVNWIVCFVLIALLWT